MILDHINNIGEYVGLSPHIAKAINYLQKTDFEQLEPGKYEVDGNEVFALVNEFTTRLQEECEAETHRKYIDIQYIVKGEERFGFGPLLDQIPTNHYIEEQDLTTYPTDDLRYVDVGAGMFLIFYPTDIHQPEIFIHLPSTVKKVVMKVKAR